jgi:hypothetical protein
LLPDNPQRYVWLQTIDSFVSWVPDGQITC